MRQKTQRGFTMVEILVAVLIMAIGLLGIAGMQSFGMRQTLNSQLLSNANSQVNDMIERMQANTLELNNAKLTPPQVTAYDNITGSETDPGCITAKTCSSSDLAQYDAYVWATANKALLNDNGTNSVTSSVIGNGDGTFTIAISWNELALSKEEDAAGGGTADNQVTQTVSIRYQP